MYLWLSYCEGETAMHQRNLLTTFECDSDGLPLRFIQSEKKVTIPIPSC